MNYWLLGISIIAASSVLQSMFRGSMIPNKCIIYTDASNLASVRCGSPIDEHHFTNINLTTTTVFIENNKIYTRNNAIFAWWFKIKMFLRGIVSNTDVVDNSVNIGGITIGNKHIGSFVKN